MNVLCDSAPPRLAIGTMQLLQRIAKEGVCIDILDNSPSIRLLISSFEAALESPKARMT
jgi:hypothetical protein